jgi:cytochrome c-type biogenesis protein CcmH
VIVVSLIFAGLALLLIGSLAYPVLRRPGDRTPARAEDARGSKRRIALLAAGATASLLLLGAGAVYAALGSPQLRREAPDRGIAGATSPAALEKQLQREPTAEGYKRLANIYFAAGQYDKAVAADHRALDLGANDATTWSEFGESIVMAGKGQVAPEALAAFTNAIDRDPNDARARFYIGMAEAQIGNLKQAVAIWRDLEKGADPDAKWLPMVRRHIAAFSKEGGFDPDSIAPAAPSAVVLRLAIASMRDALQEKEIARVGAPPAGDTATSGANDQDAMVRAMVARLAARMEKSPNDADGWRRLAHAYNVLGEPEKAREAIAHAARLKPNDPHIQSTLAETERAGPVSRKR